MNEELRARPSSISGNREGLFICELVSQFANQVSHFQRGESRWDPERGARNEGEPIGSGPLDEDGLNDVV
ncbi:hypothetical protein Pyn_02083 [Prunus yedoensis var. nudiflora]|uniref:Uncharacterized protein n=1 Tax=Prunus yedoensis var. nudiflora TaxID=2094558 RepID=A0A314ZS66_PRUYE|nr:hypothetical protein Pyn_02083 [Prunus yedoensis var. nudiflora]